MKIISLTQGKSVLIDDEDYDKVKHLQWHASKSGHRFYARAFMYAKSENKTTKTSLVLQHLIVGKAPEGQRLFFKDGDALNCQKSNLTFVSRSVASHSYYKKVKNNINAKEPFKGVVVQYTARIKIKNKIILLGCFTNEKDAAKAYNDKAIELYGERAKLNFL
jgi:hypothetical protein